MIRSSDNGGIGCAGRETGGNAGVWRGLGSGVRVEGEGEVVWRRRYRRLRHGVMVDHSVGGCLAPRTFIACLCEGNGV